jgi:cystathionine beta-synthase
MLIIMTHRIRNYMSKPWFLNIAMNSKPSPLSDVIAGILQAAPSTLPDSTPVNGAGAVKHHPK